MIRSVSRIFNRPLQYICVSEIQRDVEYRVNTIINNTTISLYITLPPQFPQEKPIVKVTPRVNHPWVNNQMIVNGAPGINNFMVHSDLGKVIREVIDEFQRNPPVLLPPEYDFGGGFPHVTSPSVTTTTHSTVSMPQPANFQYPPQTTPSALGEPALPSYISSIPVSLPHISSTAGVPNTDPSNFVIPDFDRSDLSQDHMNMSSSSLGGYRMPDIPINIPQLSELSKSDLNELLNNEDQLLQMIEGITEVQQLACDRSNLNEQNEQLARDNLQYKPLLEDKKKVLLEKFDIFNDVKQQYDDNCRRQDQLRQHYDPRSIQDNIKVAALEAEEVSEAIAESFLEGKITAEDFKKNYMEKRKLGHLRRTKEERLGQCLLNQSRGGF